MPDTATVGSYELQIEIAASREHTWNILVNEADRWWLPEFRIFGAESVIKFTASAGGQLIEESTDGRSLLWFTTQMATPNESVYLVGHCAPDWGGPFLSMLKLALTDRDNGCQLQISDSLIGNVSEGQLNSLKDGWQQVFTKGLKVAAEES